MAAIKIIEARKFPSRRPERLGKLDTLIVYNVDGKAEQTFTTIVPSDAPADSEVQAQIRTDLAERQKLLGRTFTV